MPAKKKAEKAVATTNSELEYRYKGSDAMYKALETRCEADKYEALANLTTYFSNSAGVGEHPEIVEVMTGQLHKVSVAEQKLAALRKWFGDREPLS
jgi:hypothetical protein|tara:strand:- start:526 stop:813 length:288 start_codon:yes stop_codon:yes gene_type:complete